MTYADQAATIRADVAALAADADSAVAALRSQVVDLQAALSASRTLVISVQLNLEALKAANAALQARIAELTAVTPPPPPPPPVTTTPRAFAAPTLTNPTTYTVDGAAKRKVVIPAGVDAIVRVPVVADWANGIEVQGGRNVVIEAVEVAFSRDYATAGNDQGKSNRALYLNGVSKGGICHLAGLYVHGEFSYEGVNVNNMADAVLQIRDYRLEHLRTFLPGPTAPPHYGGDALQSFIGAGPRELWIDGMTVADSDYQGIWDQGNGALRDYRRVNIGSNSKHTSFLGGGGTVTTRRAQDVWIDPGTTDSWTSTVGAEWRIAGVRQGRPPGGDFVPASITGRNYRP